MCVIFRGNVSLLDRYQTLIFSAVTVLWGSGKVSLLASKIFSNAVVTSHSSCVFLYLFSSSNISPVRLVSHLQDWWCVGKCETSFPVNKLWLIYLQPSFWTITKPIRVTDFLAQIRFTLWTSEVISHCMLHCSGVAMLTLARGWP